MKKSNYKKYMIIIIILLILSIIPLCIISHYNHPSTDDYGYAMLTRDVWRETGSIFALLKAAIHTSINFYNSWQGLYSAAFFWHYNREYSEKNIMCLPDILCFLLL